MLAILFTFFLLIFLAIAVAFCYQQGPAHRLALLVLLLILLVVMGR